MILKVIPHSVFVFVCSQLGKKKNSLTHTLSLSLYLSISLSLSLSLSLLVSSQRYMSESQLYAAAGAGTLALCAYIQARNNQQRQWLRLVRETPESSV